MSRHSPISWDAIRRSGFDARPAIPPGFLAAKGFVDLMVVSRPLFVRGKYDRTAILETAALVARSHRRRYETTWAKALSIGLTAAWRAARAARARAAH